MPLHLLTGPLNSGKTAALLDALKASLPTQAGLLVVPDRPTAAEFRRHLLAGATGASAALCSEAVLDWPSFVAKLADPRLPVLGRGQAALVVHRLLAELRPSSFGTARASLGLARQCAEAIAALKRNGIAPEELRVIIDDRGAAAKRERDLLALYARYDDELAHLGLLDEAGLAALAIERVRAGEVLLLAGRAALLVDEFHRFAPGERKLLAAIREAHPTLAIRVSLPSPERDSPHAGLFAAYLEESRRLIGAIVDREETLEAPPRTEPKARVLCARSPAQEARLAASLVAALAAGGRPPEAIVVAASPNETFLGWFATEAEAMGLLPRHPPLAEPAASPFVHRLLSPQAVEALPAKALAAEYARLVRAQATTPVEVAAWSTALARHPAARPAIARDVAAAGEVVDALARIETTAALARLGPLVREDFVRILSEELGTEAGFAAREAAFPFRLLSPTTPLAFPAEAVIVPRMIEGSIPRSPAEPPFFAAWDDARLDGATPNAAAASAAQAFAFESFVAKCRDDLLLLSPAVDDGAGETLRSAFTDRFLAPDAPPEYAAPIVPAPAAARDRGWNERLTRTLAVERARAGSGEPVPGFMGELSAREARTAVERRFTENEFNVTALQDYAGCPFLFFVRHVLGAERRDEETPEMKPSDRGTLVHKLLRRFYEECGAEAIAARTSPAAEKRLPGILAELADLLWEQSAEIVEKIAPGLRDRQRRSIERLAWQVIEAEIDEARRVDVPLKPVACEWGFGARDGRPFALPVPGGPAAALAGRVDRIDATDDGGGFLVLDYKTGPVDAVVGDIRKGLHLQLPLYIEAVAKLLCPKARALGALIVDVKNAQAGGAKETAGKVYGLVLKEAAKTSVRIGQKKSALDDEAFDELMANACRAAASSVAAIREGRFAPAPGNDCRKCVYGDGCRQKGVASD